MKVQAFLIKQNKQKGQDKKLKKQQRTGNKHSVKTTETTQPTSGVYRALFIGH